MKKIFWLVFLSMGCAIIMSACSSSTSASSEDLYETCIATYGEGSEECDNPETVE